MTDPITPAELDIHTSGVSRGSGRSRVFSTGWLDDCAIWDDVAHRLATSSRTTTCAVPTDGDDG